MVIIPTMIKCDDESSPASVCYGKDAIRQEVCGGGMNPQYSIQVNQALD